MTERSAVLEVVVGIVVREGRVLALRRARTKDAAPGAWETVSGRLEPGESPLDAVQREIVEETGVTARVDAEAVDAYDALRGTMPMRVTVFRAVWVAGEVHLSEEHDETAWMMPAEFRAATPFARLADAVDRAMRGRSR